MKCNGDVIVVEPRRRFCFCRIIVCSTQALCEKRGEPLFPLFIISCAIPVVSVESMVASYVVLVGIARSQGHALSDMMRKKPPVRSVANVCFSAYVSQKNNEIRPTSHDCLHISVLKGYRTANDFFLHPHTVDGETIFASQSHF
jgi:hypothetical protein